MDTYWSFRKIAALEEAGFNHTLERFYHLGMDGLVRENIQNSLDAKLPSTEQPVLVSIKTGVMVADEIPGINELKAHICALKGENEYTRETIEHMRQCMNKTQVPYISFADGNTRGLSGAMHGEQMRQGDTWGDYAYKKGVHHIDEDAHVESSRGGSHGIGKIACNAASDLHLMFFANCDAQGNCHMGGTIQLIEHTLGDEYYRATGYFTKIEQGYYVPFENDFASVFQKKTRGLKIVIPYLREQFQGSEQVIRAVCDNFWLAILQKKLIVKVNEVLIDAERIVELVNNKDIYEEQNYGEIRKVFTPLYIRTYLEQKPVRVIISDKSTDYQFWLYLLYDEQIKKGRTAIFRGIGMKIEDKKIASYVNAPYNAVLIPAEIKGDVFLKSLENESHTQLSWEHIKDVKTQANAKRFINHITKVMQQMIAALIQEANPSDGVIDTSELIYSVEQNFRKELSKELVTVQLTRGNKNSKKTLVKIKTTSLKNKKRKAARSETETVRTVVRRVRKKDGVGTEKTRVRYAMYPEMVRRIVLPEKELLLFDFQKAVQYTGETVCALSFSVIDGSGKTYESEFDLGESYSKIYDKNGQKDCVVKGNIIQNVTILDGKVFLEMCPTEHFNASLKFMYYVEV